jgi:hypothetical protein
MPQIRYTPDDDIKVHEEGAIKLLCAAFQSHENGLPEWAKNAADEYARKETAPEDRIIVILFQGGSSRTPASISCLDFGGMTSDVIEQHFRQWADPEAAQQGLSSRGVQGGHGNGGKCYMTQMFNEYALLHTVSQRKGCRYGVVGRSVRFGYVPDREGGRDFEVTDVAEELKRGLSVTGCNLSNLPREAQDAIIRSEGFTMVTGVAPRDIKRKIPVTRLIDSFQEHPQMIQTLQHCSVYVLANGQLVNDGRPLSLPEIPAMPGAEEPRTVPIPRRVKDPVTHRRVSTTDEGSLPEGQLVLRTSDKSMRWSRKTRHSIIFEAQSGYIGYVPVPELDIQSAYRDKIYGTCRLEALEPFKQNDRSRLAESPLTRGIENFISGQIQKYCEEFELRDKRSVNRREKDAISQINEALDRWKNRLLRELVGMHGGRGGGVDPPPPPPPPLPVGTPYRLELTIPHQRVGRGVSVRPRLKFYDRNLRRIRAVPVRWISEDTNVAVVDEDLGIVNTFTYGDTRVYAVTLDGQVCSDRIPLEVARLLEICISPSELEVPLGRRRQLEAVCTLADGSQASDVGLIWTEGNSNVARVGVAGVVVGAGLGETEVTAGDDSMLAATPARITVVEGEGGGESDGGGRGFPRVLVSGEFDPDPDTGEFRYFSSDDPPVYQMPEDFDRNIWWINSAAPMARLYLDWAQGYGYESREWRMYHLERYVDIIVQMAMTCGDSQSETQSANEWILNWGTKVAEIQAAVAADLKDFINTGKLPEV